MGRLGIDLSGESVILASVSPTAGRLQLRDYERLEATADLFGLGSDLRRARKQHRFPRRAEVVAWPGDPRVTAVRDAGFSVERVIMPGEALERVARLHHGLSLVPGVTAVLSVDSTGGALAIVRDSAVLQETALTWSTQAGAGGAGSDLLRRYAFLSELTETLGAAFSAVLRSQNARVREILTCGSLPDLRSLTMPLADEFDVEVETLDSLSTIDVRVKGRMPEEIADALPTLWVAMVASRRWHPRRRQPVRTLLKVGVPVGVAAGFALMMIAGGPKTNGPRTPQRRAEQPRATPPGSREAARAPSSPIQKPTPVREPPVHAKAAQQPPPVAAQAPRPVEPQRPPQARAQSQPQTQTPTQPVIPGGLAATSQLTQATPPPRPRVEPPLASIERVEKPFVSPPQTTATTPAAATQRVEMRPEPPPAPTAAARPEASAAAPPVEIRPVPRKAAQAPQPDFRANVANVSDLPRISLPLTSILWSAERQLVVAEGQTLEVGDTISGMRIVRIEEDSVIVRDRTGRLRRAALRGPGPGSM